MSNQLEYRIHPDADGWVNTITATEGIEDRQGIVLSEELVTMLTKAEAIVAHHDGERLAVPHDDRVLWRLLRASGYFGEEAMQRRRALRPLQAQCPDVPSGVQLPAPLSFMLPPDTPAHAFPGVPGLVLRALRHEDLDLMAPLAIETGVYGAVCPVDPPCCQPPEVHAWCQLAARLDHEQTWQLTLEFNGRPLQCELIFLDPLHPTITLTMHFNRERPHWFWREAERPVFEALLARGHRTVWTRTRKDRPDWIEAIKRNYRATEVADIELQRQKVLELPLDLARFQGWPARRSAGIGWSWTRGVVSVREATDEDVAALPAWITLAFPGHARRALALQMLEEWVHLDRATVLLTLLDGAITDVRLVRHRRGIEASIAGLSPTRAPSAEREAAAAGFYAWCAAAGYGTVNMFVRESELAVLGPAYEARLARVGWQTVQTKSWTPGRPFREMRLDLAGALAILGGNP